MRKLLLGLVAALMVVGPANAATATFHAENLPFGPSDRIMNGSMHYDGDFGPLTFDDVDAFTLTFVGGSTFTLADVQSLPSFRYMNANPGDAFYTQLGGPPDGSSYNVLTATNADLSDGFAFYIEFPSTGGAIAHWADYRAGRSGTFDNLSIIDPPVLDAVPEPSTWAMLLIGFGAVGTALRTRVKRQPATI